MRRTCLGLVYLSVALVFLAHLLLFLLVGADKKGRLLVDHFGLVGMLEPPQDPGEILFSRSVFCVPRFLSRTSEDLFRLWGYSAVLPALKLEGFLPQLP